MAQCKLSEDALPLRQEMLGRSLAAGRPARGQAALVCFLAKLSRHGRPDDRHVRQAPDKDHTHAQNELDQQMKRQRQSIQMSLSMLNPGEIILDDQ